MDLKRVIKKTKKEEKVKKVIRIEKRKKFVRKYLFEAFRVTDLASMYGMSEYPISQPYKENIYIKK